MKTQNSNDEIKKQVIEAITGDYMLICLVDLAEDTYEVIQRSASPGYEMIVDGIYSRFSEEYNRKYVDEAFQDIRGKTGSIAFLSRALHDDPFVSCDFLMKDGQARRTVFKRFETDGERVTKAILYSYRLDRARTGRLIERRRLETEYSIIDGLCSDYSLREGQKKEEKAVLEQISLVGRRILLAEDNELNAEITMELLADEDILCEHAEDGAVCLQMLQDHDADHYDLILMDIQMPNLNGYEAARAIRALPDADKARIPILALSANYLPSDRTNALDAGMDDLVAKPIDVAELLKKLRKALRD